MAHEVDQLLGVVVVGVLAVEGISDEHAANADLYFGVEVTAELVDGAPPVVFVEMVTPCSVMQLRKAASCGELAPGPAPPPKPEPAGRRLAQAWSAALALELTPKPPAGGVPVDVPVGFLPLPKPEPDTPCFFRHVVKAVLDDVDDDFVVVDVVFLVVVVGEDVAAPPPQAASTTPARAKPRIITGNFRWPLRRLSELVLFVMKTVWKSNLDER